MKTYFTISLDPQVNKSNKRKSCENPAIDITVKSGFIWAAQLTNSYQEVLCFLKNIFP